MCFAGNNARKGEERKISSKTTAHKGCSRDIKLDKLSVPTEFELAAAATPPGDSTVGEDEAGEMFTPAFLGFAIGPDPAQVFQRIHGQLPSNTGLPLATKAR